jgi:hypothetical protein
VPGGVLAAEPVGDRAAQRVVQHDPVVQRDEQWHEEPAAGQVEVDDEGAADLRHRLERGVDLSGADPDAVPVQGGVAAAQHEAAAPLVDPEEVALPPDPGEVGEVRLAVEPAVVVVPHPDRHGRHRLGDHHLAHLAGDGLAAGVERVGGHAEVARLVLAGVDRQGGRPAGEPAADVGAAAADVQPQVGLDVPVEPGVHLG